MWSLPVWERGLKRKLCKQGKPTILVAPRVGAWIETYVCYPCNKKERVAPRVGAWIETNKAIILHLPRIVAPRVGAWIETHWGKAYPGTLRRSPCGSVD